MKNKYKLNNGWEGTTTETKEEFKKLLKKGVKIVEWKQEGGK